MCAPLYISEQNKGSNADHLTTDNHAGRFRGFESISYGAFFSIYVFLFCFASTWGPIAWVYQSEILPIRLRAKGTGAATMSNW
jgi:Sugar (and other) transporter